MGEVKVGVAGWSYRDWEGIVYPPGKRDKLAFMTGFLDLIEVNSTFYRIPPASLCRSWARRTAHNPDFAINVKLHRSFTHERGAISQRDITAFKEGVEPLTESGLLGCVLAQFPWSFKNVSDNRAYLAELLDGMKELPVALEIRHSSWNVPGFLRFLEERGVIFCNIDQPMISRSIGPTEFVTAKGGYVRLHGRNYSDWFRKGAGRDARYDYLYSKEELEPWVVRIRAMSSRAMTTYVITNNHYAGKAVCNALQLKHMLTGEKVEPPSLLLTRYSQLKNIADKKG